MRKSIKTKREFLPDPVYNSLTVTKFVGHLIKDGKKSLAQKILYSALEKIKEQTKKDPLEVFDLAIKNTSPFLEVRPRRVGGATYQVPREVRGERRFSLASRWIIDAAFGRKGKSITQRLAEEIVSAAKNEGGAVKKKENIHKLAEANRAFAHFAW